MAGPVGSSPAGRRTSWATRVHGAMRGIDLVLGYVSAVLIVAIALVTLWGVFTRYVLRNPATWTYPVAAYMLLGVVYLVAGQTLERDGHVRVDLVVRWLPARWRRPLEILSAAVGVAFVAVFTLEGAQLAWQALQAREREESVLRWPLAPILGVMVLGLAVLLATYLVVIWDGFRYSPALPSAARQPGADEGAPDVAVRRPR